MNLAGEEIHFEVKNNNSFKFNIFAFMMYSLIEIIEYFKKDGRYFFWIKSM